MTYILNNLRKFVLNLMADALEGMHLNRQQEASDVMKATLLLKV